jgi:SAM-dependent methyltransferase
VRAAAASCASCGAATPALRYRLRAFDVYDCLRCGMRFRHPLPDARELAAMYEDPRYHESAYFQNTGRDYREDAPEIRIYRRGLADLAALGARGRLLDVGCGAGVFLDLARRAGWEASGVELSTRHAEAARATFGAEVWQGDFLAAPFADGAFAAITMWDFLEHVVDPRAVLARAHRLLAPGGVLLVFTIDTTSLFNGVGDALYRASGRRMVRPLELLYDARHNHYFTRAALARLLESSGFAVARWRADRAYLGRWLAEPAPWYLVAGGVVLDLVATALGRPYRRTALCRRAAETGDDAAITHAT